MRFWLDTEFIEDGETIDLLSIGIVAEDGRTYYAVSSEADWSKASPWVQEHVIPFLRETPSHERKLRYDIAREVQAFVGDQPEFWAYYADYDWVALCQLYGTMMDLPEGWPMFCLDVKQEAHRLGDPPLPRFVGDRAHDALADAIECKQRWEWLQERAA